jgi:hypothetical protein
MIVEIGGRIVGGARHTPRIAWFIHAVSPELAQARLDLSQISAPTSIASSRIDASANGEDARSGKGAAS